MKTPLAGIITVIALAFATSAFAEMEKPQAVYEIWFTPNNDHELQVHLKGIEGNSTLAPQGDWIRGRLLADEGGTPNPTLISTNDAIRFKFREFNNTKRYLFKGEMMCHLVGKAPIFRMYSDSQGKGASSQFIWKKDPLDTGASWVPFEIECVAPENRDIELAIELDPDRSEVSLRHLQLIEYGTPIGYRRAESAAAIDPQPASAPEAPFPSHRQLLIGGGIAVGAGLIGGILWTAFWTLLTRTLAHRKEAKREEELRRIASLDAPIQ